MRSFIEFNIHRRRRAKSEFESLSIKLQINSIYGKTLQNVFKQRTVKLVSSSETLIKLSSKPTFQKVDLLAPNIAAVEMKKSNGETE